jgi:hypothetical protein
LPLSGRSDDPCSSIAITASRRGQSAEPHLTSIDPALPISIESWPASLGLVLFPARVAAVSLGIMGVALH